MGSTKVGVIGSGGHAKVVIRALQELGIDLTAIFDDNPLLAGTAVYGVPVLGSTELISASGLTHGVIAIGNNETRRALSKRFQLSWLTVIHPRAIVDRTAVIGSGTVIFAGAVVQAGAWIGDHAILNTSASVDHDCRIHSFAHLGPRSCLAGDVQVGEGALMGTGSVARPGVRIGAWSTVGAGAAVVKDLADGVLAVGVPARPQVPRPGNGSHEVSLRSGPSDEASPAQPATINLNQRMEPNSMKPPRVYLSPPHMSGCERELLLEAFDSNWIAPLGPHVDAFEREFAQQVGMGHAVALSSGTAALHLSLLLMGVQPGDDVLTATLTFAATANAIRYVGANPIFLDSEPNSWNLDPDLLAEELEHCAQIGRLPKAVIAVDIMGQCADYQRIAKICNFYEVPLIEDAAEALGASYHAQPAGSFGSIGCFSFNGNKIITTSGGGMLVTNSEEWARQARHLSTQARDPAPHYEHSVVGYNYRMSNLLAAVGRGQLRVLEDRVHQRRQVFDYYQRHLGGLPGISFMTELPASRSTRWLTCILVQPDELGVTREEIRVALEDQDIEARPIWKPMHAQPVFVHCRKRGGQVAERLFELGLCLPSGSSISNEDLARVVGVIRALVKSRTAQDAPASNPMAPLRERALIAFDEAAPLIAGRRRVP